MRKPIKKRGLVYIVIMALLLLPAGCGETGQTPLSEGEVLSDGASAEPLGAYPQEITLNIGRATMTSGIFAEGDSYESNPYTRWVKDVLNVKIADAFEAQKGENNDRQVSLMISTGEIPDAMVVTLEDFLDLAESGMLADLTDIYEQYASDRLRQIYDSFDGRALDAARIDGRLMAMPSAVGDSTPNFVYVRQDWIDTLGIAFDTDGDRFVTAEEVAALAQTFIEKDPEGTGNPTGVAFDYTLTGDALNSMNAIANAYGAYPQYWFKDSSGEVYNGSTTPEMKQALGIAADWYKRGILDSQFGTRTSDDIKAMLINGQLGIVFGPWHITGWYMTDVIKANSKARYDAYVIPDASGNVNAALGKATSDYIVVSKDCKNPEAVIKIFNLQEGEGNLADMEKEWPAFYEDKLAKNCSDDAKPFYTYTEPNDELVLRYRSMRDAMEGKITPEEVKSNVRVVFQRINMYAQDPSSVPEDIFVSASANYVSYLRALGLKDQLLSGGKLAYVQPVYYGSTESMKSKGANLKDIEEQAFIKIVTGSEPLDYFDSFVKDFNTLGGQDIAKEIADITG
jgi:putative aldouronate transport system substrate-binding protein